LFTTALVVYVLASGSADLARTIIRIGALTAAAFCLAVWSAAAMHPLGWGGPVIEEFYATDILSRWLGHAAAAALLAAAAVALLLLAAREVWRLKVARLRDP